MNAVKSDDFLSLERCFSMVKQSLAVNDNLVKAESILNRVFGFTCHLSVVENTSSVFFGVNIFPPVSTMDRLIDNIVSYEKEGETPNSIWVSNDTWYIEIDSLLYGSMNVNANPAEIVALLLHEIGRVIYTDAIPTKLNRLISKEVIKLRYNIRQLIENEKIRKLFTIAVIEACTVNNLKYIEGNNLVPVDKMISDYAYSDDMNSLLNKIVKIYNNSLIDRTTEDIDKDIENIVTWCIINIKELEFRKNALRDALKVEILKTPSPYIKRMIQHIYVSFFGDSIDKYRELLSEQFMSVPKDIYQELKADQALMEHVNRILTESSGNIFDKNGKLKKITQSDIDILTVEAERIETTDDKIYLLDKLYRQLDLINLGLDYIESGDKKVTSRMTQSKPTLLKMKEQLENLREQIMATRIIDKDYGVFIKYPKGYQG